MLFTRSLKRVGEGSLKRAVMEKDMPFEVKQTSAAEQNQGVERVADKADDEGVRSGRGGSNESVENSESGPRSAEDSNNIFRSEGDAVAED